MCKFLLLAFVLTMTTSIFAQNAPPIDAGVSQTLAKWRAANYSDVRYKLNLTLEKMSPVLKGAIEIRVKVAEEAKRRKGGKEIIEANSTAPRLLDSSTPLLVLDWRKIRGKEDLSKVSNVSVNGKAAKFEEINEHLVFKDGVIKGENVIKLDFTSPIATSGAAITRYVDKEDGAEYVYSLFVPSDASTAFPVFDQPDLKARFQLSVVAPGAWRVVSNTDADVHFDIMDSSGLKGKKPNLSEPILNSTIFKETQPISTYIFAFAAGNFVNFREDLKDFYVKPEDLPEDEDEDEQKKYLQSLVKPASKDRAFIYVRKSQAEKFKQHAVEVFRLNREGVKFLESYFDYKFPFPKYDLVLLPEFPFGGMEHAGATFLREDRIIFPTEPTKNDYITRANLIFHEAAHQWFGDTVTMKWFDDLWLKEGFAEFMAYKTLEKVIPEYNAWKIFYERNKQLAYLTDATKGTTPIYQEIPNLSAAKSAYGNIVYRKAPSFLKQAEFYLGEDKFQSAVRAFLKKHEFANAEWTDLVKEFETASKQDLKDWANFWVKRKGVFKVGFGLGNGISDVKPIINYRYENDFYTDADLLMKIKVLIFSENGKRQIQELNFLPLNGSLIQFVPLELDKQPVLIFPNYQDYGYGIFLLDERSRAYVLENIQTEKDDFLRAMMWGSLWDSVREAELNPKDYVALVIKNINVESDESTIQTLLGRVSTAMNYYISDKQRDELAAQIETLLIEKMRDAPTLGQRITFYRAFLNTASSEKARTVLKDILSGKSQIKDLKLKTKDKFDIAARLAVLNDTDAPKLLADLSKAETSDEAKRYAYAAQAGFPNKENAAKFYNDFVNNKELSESYIESAFAPFNSVRRSDLTLPYLEKALAELPNLKRSRKIFFVNGWLSAFIGGQKSEQALAIVNKFLADNPNLDKDLRLKILENADGLERAVKIRGKYGK
ncbi:MAG TPA: M1 family aminopeptidase [Pyrinomonadaceae bacterium]|nr:M1 family aminopeptidase [Pyrinomonadaceae bacterium]